MKSSRIIGISAILVITAALLHWALNQNAPAQAASPPNAQTKAVPSNNGLQPSKPALMPANMPPASTNPTPNPASPPTPSDNRQAELHDALTTGLDLLHRNELGLFTRAYLRAPKPGTTFGGTNPAKISSDDQFSRGMLNSPNGPRTLQKTISFFEAMQQMTPIFNETGDQATYKGVPTSSGGAVDLIWILDNGHWYLKGNWPTAE